MKKTYFHRISTVSLLLFTAILVGATAIEFRVQHNVETLFPSPALTRIMKLSEFNSSLIGTPGDTDVFLFEGPEPGPSVLILGGTHAVEIAGIMTAVLLVESINVSAGRIFVIPHANASAATHTLPGEAHPRFIEILGPEGARRFRVGSRFTNPVHQIPDPDTFSHPKSSSQKPGRESRNLNRVYPGVRDGTLTERVAWAIVELIRSQNVDLAFDLHEAPPDRLLVNSIVASEVSSDLASEATIALQLDEWDFHLESSSQSFRGLSHREWTNSTNTRPFLMETANPLQGDFRSRTSANLAITGIDKHYLGAAQRGILACSYDSTGICLEKRISHNLAGIEAIINAYNSHAKKDSLLIDGWPNASQLQTLGLGKFLGKDASDK